LIYVITNLSVELENNKIFKKLIEKSNVVWDISFETVETKFEYVRRGSQWDLMLKNIKYLKENTSDKPGHGIGITSQYCVYNALELSTLYRSFLDYDLPIMRWNELINPDIISVSKLPQRFIDKAIEELMLSLKLQPYTPFLQEMATSLRQLNNNNTNCQELYNWHNEMEQTYWPNSNLKFANLWNEFSEI
jgi:hypothetical protein